MTLQDNHQEDAQAESNLRSRDFRFPTRENALATLHQAYATASRTNNILSGATAQERSSDIVLLSGLSGTGKSTLVKRFLRQLEASSNATSTVYPYVLQGKYDEVTGGSRPFSGIIEAFTGFAHILEFEDAGWDSQKEMNRLRESIQERLGEEASFLANIIPELADLVGKQKSHSSEAEQEVVQHGNAWNRLRYIFQAFTAAISTKDRPVILILDDLQWMDSASVELLQSLLCDHSLQHFMFIGLYRSNEVAAEHKLNVAIDSIQKSNDIKKIELANLSLTETTDFLANTLLNQDIDATNSSTEQSNDIESLAKAVFDKTQGNIFFALQCLDDLQRKDALQYSHSDATWTWNKDISDLLSTDLQGIITEKIMSASLTLQRVLTIMAYTRSSLDIRTLREIMQHNGWGLSVENLVAELKGGETTELLTNKHGSPVYSFTHDNIQQAAYELVPSGEERTQFRVDMGMRLINLYEKDNRDWLLFAGADHLNATADKKTAKSKFLLKINVQAGERAQSVAAFDAASGFLGRAIKIVEAQPDAWQTSYDSTLCLYRNLAAVEFCQGRTEAGNRLADIVLENATCVNDKLSTMNVMAKALGVEQKHKESVDLCFQTLNLMQMYPKSSIRLNSLFLRDMVAVHRFWKGHTNEQILQQLPNLRDKRKIGAIEILGSAGINGLLLGDTLTLLRTTFRSLRLSFTCGLCTFSITGIVGFMVVRIHLGDFAGAKRLADLARGVSKRLKTNQVTTRMTGVFYFVSGWNQPQLKVLKDFEQAYKAGMACGDHEFAALNRHGYCIFQYLSGYQLSLVEHRLDRLITEVTAHNAHAVRLMAEQSSLSVHILQGKVAFDYESLASYGPSQEVKSDKTELTYGYIYRMMLGIFFGRYDLSEVMLAKFKKLPGDDLAITPVSLSTLHIVLMYLSVYHDGGHKRNKNRAKPYIKQLEAFNKGLGTNSLHRLMIMKAHANASKHTTLAEIKKGYDDAVQHCVKTGHIQDAGLACQMAAQYLSSKVAKEKVYDTTESAKLDTAGVYLKKAVKYYKKWGAEGLVDHLQRRYDAGSSVLGGTSIAGDASKLSGSLRGDRKDLNEPSLFDF